jgi:hypothetical protein
MADCLENWMGLHLVHERLLVHVKQLVQLKVIPMVMTSVLLMVSLMVLPKESQRATTTVLMMVSLKVFRLVMRLAHARLLVQQKALLMVMLMADVI